MGTCEYSGALTYPPTDSSGPVFLKCQRGVTSKSMLSLSELTLPEEVK